MQLTDTNVISELVRASPNPGVLRWVESQRRLCISVVTLDELTYGVARKPSARLLSWLDDLVADCDVLDVTPAIARRAGQMRAMLAIKGQVRTQADMLIAATAQVHALTLVTRNTRDFDGCAVAVLNPFQ